MSDQPCDNIREDGAKCSMEGTHDYHIGWVEKPSNVVTWPNEDYVPHLEIGIESAMLSLARRIRKGNDDGNDKGNLPVL